MWALSYVTILMSNMVAVPLDKGLEIGELEDSLIRRIFLASLLRQVS